MPGPENTQDADSGAPRPFRILVLKLGALGDVVRTSYILPGLHERFGPGTSVTWITAPAALPILRFNPYVATLLSTDQRGQPEWVNALHSTPFDWVLSLDDEAESCGIADTVSAGKVSGAFIQSGGIQYTEDTREWFDMGLISRFGKTEADRLKIANSASHDEIFARMLGIKISAPAFHNDPHIEAKAKERLKALPRKIVGLNLGAGKRWPSKSLRTVEAIRLIDRLREHEVTCVLLGGKDDSAYLDAITSQREITVFDDLTLEEFAGVIRELDLLITSDTLAVHLAIAQRVPNLSYYAPTSAAEINTFGSGLKIASSAPDYCSYLPHADNSTITADRLLPAAVTLLTKV